MTRTRTSATLSMFNLLEGLDMGRKRGQRKGHLRPVGPSWIGEWREDIRLLDGAIERQKMSRVIAPRTGPHAKTKREAQRIFENEVLAKLDSVAIKLVTMATIAEFIVGRYEPDILAAKRKRSTREFIVHMLKNHVIPEFGNTRMRDITPDQIKRWLLRKERQGLSVATVRHCRNMLSAVLRYAKELDYFPGELPTAYVRTPEMRRVRKPSSLTWEEVRAIAEAMPRYRLLVYFLAISGVRIGEALGLRWRYVNITDRLIAVNGVALEPGTVWIAEAWVRSERVTVKQDRPRKLPLPLSLVNELRNLKASTPYGMPDDPVFVSKNGTPLDGHNIARRHLKPTVKSLGLNPLISWHWFRHTATSFAEQVGMSPVDRRKGLGHTTDSMTMHYSHADVERVRAGLDLVANRLFSGDEGEVVEFPEFKRAT